MVKIACLKHVEYEGPAYFPHWAERHGLVLDQFLVPEVGLPRPGAYDRLIIIGGPMSVWETDRHPWLTREKEFLAEALTARTPVLGICLGAQLLAECLGAAVGPAEHKEIGWFDLETAREAGSTWLGDALPAKFRSFLWHGDCFALPGGAVPVAGGAAHPVQGFIQARNLALQFHLEVTPAWAARLAARDAHELVPAPFIQSATEITGAPEARYLENNRLLDRVMERWLG